MTESNGSTELSRLWVEAVESYEKTTGKSVHLGQINNIDQVINNMQDLSDTFKDFRDDKPKVSQLRTTFKSNLWLIKDIVNSVKAVGNAASIFPPAMPATLIFSVLDQVMQSFADVSADYDKVIAFFEFSHRFFDRMSIIDQRMPDSFPFQRCVIRVFSSFLTICSITQKYCREKRLKRWAESLLKGSDSDLTKATTDMEKAVNELSQAVGLATLSHVEILQGLTQSMNGNVELLVSNMSTVEASTTSIMEQNGELSSKLESVANLQRETSKAVAQQCQTLNNIVAYFGSIQMGEKFGDDFQSSLLKMSVLRLKVSRWAKSVGLEDRKDVGACNSFSPEDISQMEELLSGIMDQFSVAEGISKRLQRRNSGVKLLEPAKELDPVATSLYQTMTDLVQQRQGNSDPNTNGLALYEEKNYTQLIDNISDLVEDLLQLFPESEKNQQALCKQEVAEMGKIDGALPLLKTVAGDDKLLAETVEKVIQSTSIYNTHVVFSGNNSGIQIGTNTGTITGFRFG